MLGYTEKADVDYQELTVQPGDLFILAGSLPRTVDVPAVLRQQGSADLATLQGSSGARAARGLPRLEHHLRRPQAAILSREAPVSAPPDDGLAVAARAHHLDGAFVDRAEACRMREVAADCRRQCRSAAERRKLKRLALRVPPEMLEVRSRRQKRARCA